jgi:hypothetical protein
MTAKQHQVSHLVVGRLYNTPPWHGVILKKRTFRVSREGESENDEEFDASYQQELGYFLTSENGE